MALGHVAVASAVGPMRQGFGSALSDAVSPEPVTMSGTHPVCWMT